MDTFSIVFICTGNRFRSALAEAFVQRLTVGLPVRAQSFGTLELPDAPALPEAITIARSCDIDLTGHRACCVSSASLADVDLVLGFDDSHVRHAVVDADAPRKQSFTLKHFVRLLAAVAPLEDSNVAIRARDAVEQAAEHRRSHPASASDEVGDPLGRPWRVYRETAAEIRELSLQLVATLFGVSGSSGLPPVPSRLKRPSPVRWWRAHKTVSR
jgi:protein-tyrosine-phosphatase